MKFSITMACAVLSACAAPVHLMATRPVRSAAAEQLAPIPRFVVLPALDYRPRSEREGRGLERGFMMLVAGGGGLGKSSGTAILGSDDELRWSRNPFVGLATSPSTGVAGDLGASLEEASGRPVVFDTGELDAIAARAANGTVLVSVVIDHLTKLTPGNHEFEQTKHDEARADGVYEVTTTKTKTETFGAFWVFSFRIQLAQVEDGRIARRRVRYATMESSEQSGYSAAIHAASDTVIATVAASWAAPAVDVPIAEAPVSERID